MAVYASTITSLLILLLTINTLAIALGLPAPTTTALVGSTKTELSLIVIGGDKVFSQTGSSGNAAVDIISLAANSHRNGALSPNVTSKFGGILINDTIYIVGGYWRDTFWAYNVPQNTWTQLPDFPQPVAGSQLVRVNNTLIAIGGSVSPAFGSEINQVYGYDLSMGNTGEWLSVSDNPDGEGDHNDPCAVVLNNSIFYINSDTIWHSLDVGATWTEMTTKLVERIVYFTCVAVGDDTIWVIGGGEPDNRVLSSVEVYNITSNSVSTVEIQPMPKQRAAHAAVVLPDSGDVLVCGGANYEEHYGEDAFTDCILYSMEDKNWTLSKYKLDEPRAQFGLFVAQTPTGS